MRRSELYALVLSALLIGFAAGFLMALATEPPPKPCERIERVTEAGTVRL